MFKKLDAELVHIIVVPRSVDDVVKVAQLNGKSKCRSSQSVRGSTELLNEPTASFTLWMSRP